MNLVVVVEVPGSGPSEPPVPAVNFQVCVPDRPRPMSMISHAKRPMI